tara:strand:- start:1374 stop:2333 length:960 start_codon:yes stop_codon:yes gene_type:complete
MTKPTYKRHDPKTPDDDPVAPLAHLNGIRPDAPAWFDRALKATSDSGKVDVEGAAISWKAWGKIGDPGLILVHGGVAHKQWWDALAPYLSADRRVVALDLSGMGDSDWRDEYRMDLYAREVRAAGEAGGAFKAGKPFVVGHSFGGFVALTCSVEFGADIAGAVILDSPIREPEKQRSSAPPQRGGKIYDSLDYAIGRFRLLPHQPCDNLFLLDHIARESLKEQDGGWTWKFDPNLWAKLAYSRRDPAEMLAKMACPVAFFRGADTSLVTDEIWEFMKLAFPAAPFAAIPEAKHHLILDQPLAVVAALETLFASGWGKVG